MTTALLNGVVKNGQKNGRSHRPFLKFATCLIFVTFVTALYILGDFTSIGYIQLIERTEDIDRISYFTYINISHEEKKEGYLVWSPSCQIPDISPWHESIKPFIKKDTLPSCGKPLTKVQRNEENHVLIADVKDMQCCYSLITRTDVPSNKTYNTKADDVYSIGKCKDFKSNVTFSGSEQFIKIKCDPKKKKTNIKSYTGFHAFVRKTAEVKKKMDANDFDQTRVSVMIIGIDSISRLNLIRTMPLTVDYLNKRGWINFKGYNKVDDNTFPNLMAILTGKTVEQLRSSCWGPNSKKLDDCPLIWNQFSKQGYVTGYAEDLPNIGSFNYRKTGFVKTPTDYYIRPFMLAAEKFLKLKVKNTLNVCLGPTSTSDYILDYLIDFAKTFYNTLTFSLFWLNNFSHNDVNTPSAMDKRMLSFFTDLKSTQALENTLIIFISDHGIRYGKIRETYVGWIEERLPFIYFWVPPKFKKIHPERYHNLLINADRLTSPYDLHLSLKDLLGMPKNGTAACPTCHSLFDEVPWNRSCINAGITEHWCTCAEYKSLSTESAPVRAIARFVLDHINGLLINGTTSLVNGTKCAKLKVNRVVSVRSKIFSKKLGHNEYVILFETLPGEALLEATVKHKNSFKVMDTVSRVNAYASQSKCIKDAFLAKYCFCQYD
ncbi:uncharacterized protein [Halyomorpha halys]|nr:uncharacterized protein LOC106692791 isoform X2 [Halyomorpha halys]XP_014294451.1 uncharacterized protein LOC106692791 isoform X2 [Halyomorpha halys]XP_014294452.1 uncharacterized protein LOC106692791 isoform X2 [Halyomorpha halys]XP_014294453.1 uncharacterized protein LOC106692791 isoform X2 [Halyomorpha halys]